MNFIRSSPLAWVTLALCAAAVVTLAPLLVPVVLAAWTAMIARPLLDRLARALKGRNTAAAVMITVLVLVLVSTVGFLVTAVIEGSGELWGLVTTSQGAPSALKALVSPEGATEGQQFALPKSPQELIGWIEAHGSQIAQVLGGIAGTAVKVVVGAIVFFFGTWTFLIEGPRAWDWAQEHVPMAPKHLQRFGAAFVETGRGLLIGVGLTSASQAALATVIYLSLGIPRALVLGLLTGVASFIPLLGAALVWAPVAAGLFLTDHPVKALVMAGLGFGGISSMDNVLRPIFSRYGKLDLGVYVLFLSVFGGLAAWGAFGAMLGPLVVRLAVEALTLMREERETNASRSPPV
jgi:predicted PurR-regulated permease PerM